MSGVLSDTDGLTGAGRTKCDHVICGDKEKVWLPHSYRGRERGLQPHRYCVKCGLVERHSDERPFSIGRYMNALARIASEFKVAKVQTRLISMEMERCVLEDSFGMDRRQQEDLFVGIVGKYLNLSEEKVRKFL